MPNYVWSDPDRPLNICLSLDVLGRLAVEGPATAVGGLLLGQSVFEDGRHVISIDDFEPVEIERLPDAVDQHPDAVGMYRTETHQESAEIQSDSTILFTHYFTEPDALLLLVHPAVGRASLFTAEGESFLLLHDFAFRQTGLKPVEKWWHIPRTYHWLLEVLALLFGIVAGAALFQRFQIAHPAAPNVHKIVSSSLPVAATALPAPAAPRDPEPHLSPFSPPARPAETKPPLPSKTVRGTMQAGEADRLRDAEPHPSPAPPPVKTVAAPPRPALKPPPSKPAPVTPPAPARSRPRTSEPAISVDAEPVAGSPLGKVVGHIPLIRRLRRPQDPVVPPSPLHPVNPKLSAGERAELTDPVQVNVRVYVSEDGKVRYAELLTSARHHPKLAGAAVFASRRWVFKPAVQSGQHVPGEVILHFHFAPPAAL